MPAVCLHGVSRKTETRNKMNTYYIKQDNGAFAEVTFSDGMLITMIAEKLVGDSLLKATEVIKDTIQKRVSEVIYQSDLGTRTLNYLSTMSITDVVDEAVKDAVAEYDYDGVIENALDDVDIDEMVREKVTDHLDSSSIQVRIN
jgi:hypothetical protein